MTVQENLSSFGQLPRNRLYKWRSFVVSLQKSCLVHSQSSIYSSDTTRYVIACWTASCLFHAKATPVNRSASSRPRTVPSLFRCDPIENRKHTFNFSPSPAEPLVVSVLFLRGLGVFVA